MVTAVYEEETDRQALKMGAFGYITKPLDFHTWSGACGPRSC